MKDKSDSVDTRDTKKHPSHSREARRTGFGIGGGYERPYKQKDPAQARKGEYGAISHGGYYGDGKTSPRFKVGEATFQDELSWYQVQFGEKTSGYED